MREHGGNPWRHGRLANDLLDFSASINPEGPPESALEVLRNSLDTIRHYPEPQALTLKHALAERHGVHPCNVIVGNGSSEIVFLLFRALGPQRTLVVHPTFSEYQVASEASGGHAVQHLPVPPTAVPDPEAIARRLHGVGVVCICNPNNPTGRLWERSTLLALAREASSTGGILLVDEAFMDFVSPANRQGLSVLGGKLPRNVFLLRSFTKVFAIPGLRLGYGIGASSLVNRMENLRDPWSVNSLAQAAGMACLGEEGHVDNAARHARESGEELLELLSGIPGIRPLPSMANYILCELAVPGVSSGQVTEAMANRKILIRDCSSFPGLGDKHFRVAVMRKEWNRLLCEALQQVMSDLLPG